MPRTVRTRIVTGLLSLSICSASAAAAENPPSELTPVGAEAGANADGSIPIWGGGLVQPPVGWSPAQGYVDPFGGEKPLYVITRANAAQYRDKLSAGEQALLDKVADFRMPVYPTHRSAAYPKFVMDRAQAQAGKVLLDNGALKNLGGSTIPFPAPKAGIEAIWNHLVRYLGGGIERGFDSFPVRPNGDYMKVGFHELRIYDENFDQHMDNRLFSYLGFFTGPADLIGTFFLVHEPIDQVRESRRAWIYNAGQRRVRRAPDLAYDNAQNGSDGLAIVDQYDGYNGSPDRFDWKLLGKRELFVSYNDYAIADKKIPYSSIVHRGTPNADYMRYELHRVWVVEATLKAGMSHIYSRRTFYLDEDSWSVLLDDAYDSHGQLWRTGIHGLVQFYDVQVPWYRFELWQDLTSGAYVLTGLDNAVTAPWKFGIKGQMVDFDVDALRRRGVN
jgi:hypothetical protein